MHSKEILQRYTTETAEFYHKAILINVNKSAAKEELYDATRFAWKIGNKANDAELILATRPGMIVGVFVPEKWLIATTDNFPGKENIPGRK